MTLRMSVRAKAGVPCIGATASESTVESDSQTARPETAYGKTDADAAHT